MIALLEASAGLCGLACQVFLIIVQLSFGKSIGGFHFPLDSGAHVGCGLAVAHTKRAALLDAFCA
jgi:hypothetical protein